MKLSRYRTTGFDRGRSAVVEGLWLCVHAVAFARVNPINASRVAALRLFGARIGSGVVIKPGVRVKFPWRLTIGDHSWIGESVWIDNLAPVTIGSDSCVSQGTYLCTGTHDWSRETFDLATHPISIGEQVWIAARATVGPGVCVGDGAVVTLGTVVTRSVPPAHICSGSLGEQHLQPKIAPPAAPCPGFDGRWPCPYHARENP
jgi:putative colanic acid biosynthesis acetyltransferase WcaF